MALTKSATSPRAAADLITRATSHPGTFLFTELLDAPQIQALASSSEFSSHLALLRIFSYGSYAVYKATPGLPALNDAQALKLRQLSFLSLAKDRSALSYASLKQSLDVPTSRALEDLVISAIYAGLISAVLDPRGQAVQISAVAPLRDLAPGAVADMARALEAWSGRLETTLAGLDARAEAIRAEARQRAADRRSQEAAMADLVEEERGSLGRLQNARDLAGLVNDSGASRKKALTSQDVMKAFRYGKRGVGHLDASDGAADEEAMDVDDDEDEGDPKKRASRRKL